MTDQRSPELDDEDLETAYAGLLSASDQPTDLLPGVRARVAKRRRARQVRFAVAVASCVAVVIGVVSVQLIPTDEPVVAGAPATVAGPQATEPAPTPAPSATRTGPIPLGPATECFAPEDRPDLGEAEWAVDATVSGLTVGSKTARVTLTVHHWYRGGSGEQVEATVPGSDVAENVPAAFGIGTRILMSGGLDGRTHSGWPCGYSRYYDAKTAAIWEQAFR